MIIIALPTRWDAGTDQGFSSLLLSPVDSQNRMAPYCRSTANTFRRNIFFIKAVQGDQIIRVNNTDLTNATQVVFESLHDD